MLARFITHPRDAVVNGFPAFCLRSNEKNRHDILGAITKLSLYHESSRM